MPATNTVGTQRYADGSQIAGVRGRDAIYVWTDTALFTQRFVINHLCLFFKVNMILIKRMC